MDNVVMVKAQSELGVWQEHWVRIRRWQTRLIRMCDGLPDGLTREDALDDVLAFFLICYHFRDALIRSGDCHETEIDAYIESTDVLALCRDLAVAGKRMTAAPMPMLGPSGQHYCEPVPGEQWLVETDAGPKDIFDLAVECHDAWWTYLGRLI
jgi:hypothetical protein